jgi:hypothetical protein
MLLPALPHLNQDNMSQLFFFFFQLPNHPSSAIGLM